MNKSIFACLVLYFLLSLNNVLATEKPDIRIKVAEYENSFEFIMPDGGTWEYGNEKGKIENNKKYIISGKLLRESIKKYHIIVGSTKINEPAQFSELANKYAFLSPYKIEIGEKPVNGFPENRLIYLAVKNFDSEEDAIKYQDVLAESNISSWIYYEAIQKPLASIKLTYKGKTLAEGQKSFFLKPTKQTILNKVEYAKGFSWHGFENRAYNGILEVKYGYSDNIECIETTDMETILAGVVPSEILPSSPDAALQAQAVAARGEILSKKGVKHFGCGYDTCSEQHCQVYKGITKILSKMSVAIKPTKGLVMENDDGTILDAVYGANCGGHSAANDKIWVSNYNPHLQGVDDLVAKGIIKDLTKEENVKDYIENPPDCWCGRKAEGASKYRWTKTITKDEWKIIEDTANIGNIRSVEIIEREVSGRIISMRLIGSEGQKTILKELPIRKLLGAGAVLKSSCFIAEFNKDKDGFINGATLKGAGWGHGVGMCQTGAQSRAKAGQNFKQILEHYFPNSKFVKLY